MDCQSRRGGFVLCVGFPSSLSFGLLERRGGRGWFGHTGGVVKYEEGERGRMGGGVWLIVGGLSYARME